MVQVSGQEQRERALLRPDIGPDIHIPRGRGAGEEATAQAQLRVLIEHDVDDTRRTLRITLG